MKKLLALLLAGMLVFSCCAASAEASESEADPRILIAYFAVAENSEVDAVSSASVYVDEAGEACGFSRVLADVIADVTGGDLYSITTDVDYPANIGELIEYDSQEKEDGVRPALTGEPLNLEDYDVIFIGYPIWWYGLPPVMLSFFDAYDFSGKTIIPFCTHLGSRFSGTIEDIAAMEPGAVVVEDGFTVQFDQAPAAEADERAWLSRLGY